MMYLKRHSTLTNFLLYSFFGLVLKAAAPIRRHLSISVLDGKKETRSGGLDSAMIKRDTVWVTTNLNLMQLWPMMKPQNS